MPTIIHLSNIFEHTLNETLNHDNKSEVGIIMRSWVKHNKLEDMTSLLINDLNDFTPSGTLSYFKEKVESEEAIMMAATPLKELYNLTDTSNISYLGKYMKFVIYHSSTSTEPRNTSNQNLDSFRKGIKKEETAYPTHRDERNSFSRSLYITVKSHECEEVLDPKYTQTSSEKELFEAKQLLMFSVLDKHLLIDMGKINVRKYVHTTDAQSVWKDFQEHMKSSSKGASEKRGLTQYVTIQFWMTITKVLLNSLYCTLMSNSDS